MGFNISHKVWGIAIAPPPQLFGNFSKHNTELHNLSKTVHDSALYIEEGLYKKLFSLFGFL